MRSGTIEKSKLPVTDNEETPAQIKRFLQSVEESTCYYYASDFLDDENLGAIEEKVQHMFEVFQTLQVPTENHCYLVFRCTPESMVYKDWKMSDLACAYMLMNGDVTDVMVVAAQQSMLLNQILNAMHPHKAAPIT
jgi:hypothetical protein